MHGRSATVRPSTHSVDAAGTGELRRRVAVAVARRFGGSARSVVMAAMPANVPCIAAMAMPVEVPSNEAGAETQALDARVRETGEW